MYRWEEAALKSRLKVIWPFWIRRSRSTFLPRIGTSPDWLSSSAVTVRQEPLGNLTPLGRVTLPEKLIVEVVVVLDRDPCNPVPVPLEPVPPPPDEELLQLSQLLEVTPGVSEDQLDQLDQLVLPPGSPPEVQLVLLPPGSPEDQLDVLDQLLCV